MVSDQKVLAALRAWWELGPDDQMPWQDESERDQTHFREASMRDMRAAIQAAQDLKEYPAMTTTDTVELPRSVVEIDAVELNRYKEALGLIAAGVAQDPKLIALKALGRA